MTDAAALMTRYRQEGVNRVKLGVTDIDGVIRGKYLSLDKFESIVTDTSGFCDCVLGWDVADELYDNATFTGWHTAFPDALYKLDLSTERRLRDENNIPYFIGQFNEFMDYCLDHDFEVEGLHCETGPGVWEAAIAVDEAREAADKAALFKTFTKGFFQRREKLATFKAKWSMDYPGQSGHCHQSLFDLKSGKGMFFDAEAEHGMSEMQRQYVAGQQKYMRPFLAMTSPTINSYTRLVKGFWAPTAATWGIDNRTTALRVITGSEKSQRVEFRVGCADANPYLVAAATLGAGLLGIEEKLVLGDRVTGNAYDIQDDLPASQQLPANLRDANREFVKSEAARDLFGEPFVDHFAASRDWEVREHEKSVTDWQLKRYFEII